MTELTGIPAANGIAVATAVKAQTISTGPDAAPPTLQTVVEQCLAFVEALYDKTLAQLDEKSAEIFVSYKSMLGDKYLAAAIEKQQATGLALPDAINTALVEMARPFEKAKSEYMRQRAEDIHAIKAMLLRQALGEAVSFPVPKGQEPFVVFAESLSPADTMYLDTTRLAGLATEQGGATSHVVILAKTLGIPAIVGFGGLAQVQSGMQVVLDGFTGKVFANPDATCLRAAAAKKAGHENLVRAAALLPQGPVATKDGVSVDVCVNIGTSKDLEGLDLACLHGVGLYRTEFVFSERQSAPTVEDQCAEYSKVFEALDGRSLVVRTLDVGGDKNIPYIQTPREDNPFLGCRGIRLCLLHKELLRGQLTALAIAAGGRPFSIMIPMVATLQEFLQAKNIWEEIKKEVAGKGHPVSDEVQLGIMIETPAAVFCADAFAAQVDFASIGTNDLVQYIMCADRGNSLLGGLSSHSQPAVVRALAHIISVFNQHGKKISVCGEAAADTGFLPTLLGMGLTNISVGKSAIPLVRHCLAQTDTKAERQKLVEVLAAKGM